MRRPDLSYDVVKRGAYRNTPPIRKPRKKWQHPKNKHDLRNSALLMLWRLVLAGTIISWLDYRGF